MNENLFDSPENWDESPTRTHFGESQAPVTPDSIGPYKVIRPLGAGGMGEVYLAEQPPPLRREVAVKLIKLGMDTRRVIARFESERQALALMNHPNVARVFDAGAARDGRPYFVMEYVEGESILAYCDRRRLSLQGRLNLFIQACQGVQHAHHKGIIHRDLKPSNIMVAEEQGEPVVKIIDFGLAKAMDPESEAGETRFTVAGTAVGTPDYMSPEHVSGGHDIDTRSDVYSLGVVLYELLVGARPYPPASSPAGFAQTLRLILEEPPPRPSSRLSQPGTSSGEIAESRSLDPETLARQVKGDLDWITMKALDKDRNRRYNSPSELAADLRRHLNNEPVLAGPPSFVYSMRKFAQRHRAWILAGAVMVVVLVTAASAGTWLAIRASRAEQVARKEAESARAVADFLVNLFREADPRKTRRGDVPIREVLFQGERRARSELKSQPLIRARLLNAIGDVYNSIGLYEQALPIHEEVLKLYRSDTSADRGLFADAANSLANTYHQVDRNEEAIKLYRESLVILGEAPDVVRRARIQNNLAMALRRHGNSAEADRFVRSSLALYESNGMQDSANYAVALEELGEVADSQSKHEEALSIRRRARDIFVKVYGEDHYMVGILDQDIGRSLDNLGRHKEAEQAYREALKLVEHDLGPGHTSVAAVLNNLAIVLQAQGKLDEARAAYERSLSINENIFGPDHRTLASIHSNLAVVLEKQKQLDPAEKHLLRSVEIRNKSLPPDHPEQVSSFINLGYFYFNQHDLSRAEPAFQRALAILRKQERPDKENLGITLNNLAEVRAERRQWTEAEQYFREALAIWRATLPPDHPYVKYTGDGLLNVLDKTGKKEEATQLRAELAQAAKKK